MGLTPQVGASVIHVAGEFGQELSLTRRSLFKVPGRYRCGQPPGRPLAV